MSQALGETSRVVESELASRTGFEIETIRIQPVDRTDQEVEATLAKAAATISDLVNYNQALRAEAEVVLADLRRVRAVEKERGENLKATVEATLAEGERMFRENERILHDLESGKRDLEEQVVRNTNELASVKQRLEKLSSNWRDQLHDAIKKAEGFNRQK